METTAPQIKHFRKHGFFLIPNPFGEAKMREIDSIMTVNAEEWERTDWLKQGFNELACQFLMVGEPMLEIAERPELLEMAKRLLDCDEVHIGACGLGNALQILSRDKRPNQQVHWHADGGPDVQQVAFRTALDRHDPTNAPLRILPGSHLQQREEVWEELMQCELLTGQHNSAPPHAFTKHPDEVEVILDPRWTLVWTPSCWHATGTKMAAGPRRAMGWNYFPSSFSRRRDINALKHIFADEWEGWSDERKRLWGLAG